LKKVYSQKLNANDFLKGGTLHSIIQQQSTLCSDPTIHEGDCAHMIAFVSATAIQRRGHSCKKPGGLSQAFRRGRKLAKQSKEKVSARTSCDRSISQPPLTSSYLEEA
jgi:hypothetical protein